MLEAHTMTTHQLSPELVEAYLTAKATTIAAGYQAEIDWQTAVSLDTLTEPDFLRNTAFVIIVSGFRWAVADRMFPAISVAFLDWQSAAAIVDQADTCLTAASRIFRNYRKLKAIVNVCRRVAVTGFPVVHEAIRREGVDYLRTLPFIGPVTVFHLAKNVGLDCAKPDRHLVRIAAAAGYPSAQALCEALAASTGDKVSVVDIVLWRYATMVPGYMADFGQP